jgi:hypothetical protein
MLMVVAALPRVAGAAPIFGVLDIAAAVRVTATEINWLPEVVPGTGDALVQPTSTGTFAGLGGTIDRVQDLNVAQFPTGPEGTFTPLPFFQMLLAAPNINFVLESIAPCGALGLACPFGTDSPFGFTQVLGNTTVTMVMTGTVFDITTPLLASDWEGVWTAQFPGQTIGEVVLEFATMGFIETSYSASKVTVQQVPEPAMLLVFAMGAALVGRRMRRR